MSEEVNTEKVATAIQGRYVDTFVKVATQLGFGPNSEDELVDMLKIASRIREVQEAQPATHQKQASAGQVKLACENLYSATDAWLVNAEA